MQLKTHWHLRMSLPCWFQNNNSNLYCTPGFHCQVTQSIILDHCWGISSKQLDQGIPHSNVSFFMSWVMSQPAYQCRLNCVVSSFVSSFENVRLTNTSQVISLTSPVPAAMVPRDISTLPSTLPPGLLLQQPFILGPLFCPVLAKTVSQTVAAKYVDVSNLSANIIHTARISCSFGWAFGFYAFNYKQLHMNQAGWPWACNNFKTLQGLQSMMDSTIHWATCWNHLAQPHSKFSAGLGVGIIDLLLQSCHFAHHCSHCWVSLNPCLSFSGTKFICKQLLPSLLSSSSCSRHLWGTPLYFTAF